MRIGNAVFTRMELAGAFGDLGTLLPIALGMIMVNGLPATGLFCAVGLFYIGAGAYYRVPVAVQPMKVVGAYAIATAASPEVVQASSLLIALSLLVIGTGNWISNIARLVPKAVVRGVQLSTGLTLAAQGFRFIGGSTTFQQHLGLAEPALAVQYLGPVPIGVALGAVFGLLAFATLESKRFPAGIVLVVSGGLAGLALGAADGMDLGHLGFNFPPLMPFGFPGWEAISLAAVAMVLPQLPMTLGNAVVANADLTHEYFPGSKRRVTPSSLCLSMGVANMLTFLFGGMPLCHGAGGLAAHYRFGARTSGMNLIIGGAFLLLALVFGESSQAALSLLPLSVLGVLLVFAGLTLCLTIVDLKNRVEFFVVLAMAACALAYDLAVAFAVGVALAYLLRSPRFSV